MNSTDTTASAKAATPNIKAIEHFGGKIVRQAVFNGIMNVIAFIFIINIAWIAIANTFNVGLDETDLNGWNRSGTKVIIDHPTGCQYLRGVGPRLDPNGKQICR